MSVKLISVGYVSLDTIRIGKRESQLAGGAALHATLGASCFVESAIVSRVGSDFPKWVLHDLKKEGVDVNGIKAVEGESSRFSVSYDSDWHETYDTAVFGVGDDISVGDLPFSYLNAKALLINSMHPDLQAGWVSLGKSLDIFVGLTTNYFFTKNRELSKLVLESLHNIDFFVCNNREASSLIDELSIQDLLKHLSGFIKYPVITSGADGAYFLKEGKLVNRNAPETFLLDPTGAGDVFAGALMGAFLRYDDLSRAVEAALIASSVSVSNFGSSELLKKSARQSIIDQLNNKSLPRVIEP
jgi:cytidine kinase